MDKEFWHERWENNQIAFHEGAANALLVAQIDALALSPGDRIFLPLCGKTRDIGWLLGRGLRVVGVELSALAVAQLFEDLALAPETSRHGALTRHASGGLEVYVGDIFELTAETLGPVDAVYDRAALVAMPETMRARYAAQIAALAAGAPQLLICFEYDQAIMQGPPFSVTAAMLEELYSPDLTRTELARRQVPGGLKGHSAVQEVAWHLG